MVAYKMVGRPYGALLWNKGWEAPALDIEIGQYRALYSRVKGLNYLKGGGGAALHLHHQRAIYLPALPPMSHIPPGPPTNENIPGRQGLLLKRANGRGPPLE